MTLSIPNLQYNGTLYIAIDNRTWFSKILSSKCISEAEFSKFFTLKNFQIYGSMLATVHYLYHFV